MLFALVSILAIYLALAAVLTLTQGRIIYPAPTGPGSAPAGFERVTYETSDGLKLAAGYRAARAGYPTILYFHGNGADWQSSVIATDRLVPEGYGVLAAEYRGYRGNPGAAKRGGALPRRTRGGGVARRPRRAAGAHGGDRQLDRRGRRHADRA